MIARFLVTASTTPAGTTSSTLARMVSLRRGVAAVTVAAGGAAAVPAGCLVVMVVSFLSRPGGLAQLVPGRRAEGSHRASRQCAGDIAAVHGSPCPA